MPLNEKKYRSELNGIKKPTPFPPEVMASNIPWDKVDKNKTIKKMILLVFENRTVNTNDHSNAKAMECVKPRWPNICSYGIPKLKAKTSASGRIDDSMANSIKIFKSCLSITFEMVNAKIPWPKRDAIILYF